MSHHLTEQQLIELRQAFAWFDKKNQGLITDDDLRECMNGLGFYPRKSQLSQIIEGASTDKLLTENGISFPDFLVMMSGVLEKTTAIEEMEQVFELLDMDGSESLNIEELYIMLKALGEDYSMDEILEMVKFADFNSDGSISFEEFIKMLMY